ncbi:MAG: acyltransferase [Proteobacteria bacterium]|nr:acyltransferase [Pseudomonadota bacterium]
MLANRYRADIDGLRAIAVAAVVAFHAFPDLVPGGFVGVDVFFVISGFLITSILAHQVHAGGISFTRFYSRRARRILPALCLVLLACLGFGYLALLPEEFANLGRHMAAAAAFAANLSFWRESGYFAPASEFQPLLHLWSLGIEEQFYLVWPVVLAVAWRRGFNLTRVILALTAVSFALNLVVTPIDSVAGFYFPLSRFWELGLGCCLAIVSKRSVASGPARRLLRHGASFGAVLIGISILAFDRRTPFPGVAALLPTLGAVTILASEEDSWFRRRILASRPLVFIGLISYPLYLWHWPLLSFEAILHAGTPHPIYRVAAVLLSVVLATLTYYCLELPIRHKRAVPIGIALASGAAMIGLFGLAIAVHRGLPSRFPPAVSAMSQPPREDESCRNSVGLKTQYNYCKRTRADTPQVVFLGDSQAQGIYEGVVDALSQKRSMILLGRGGCPPGLNVVSSPGVYESEERREMCNRTWAEFADYVRRTRPELVVLVGDGSRFFGLVPTDDNELEAATGNPAAFRAGLNDLVTRLEPYSRVAYVLEIPTFETAPACFLRPVKLPGSRCSERISRGSLVASRAVYQQSVREIHVQHPDMLVVDPIPSLCGSTSCSQTSRGGQVLYSDKMHLSPAGARRFAENSGFAQLVAEAALDR